MNHPASRAVSFRTIVFRTVAFRGTRRAVLSLLVSAALAAALAGCAVTQSMTLDRDAAGTASLEISLHRVLTEYLIALAESIEGPLPEERRAVFDLDEIRMSFAFRPGIELVSAESPEIGKLELSLAYGPLERVFTLSEPGIREVFTLVRSGGRTTLRFHLDLSNFDSLAGLFPLYETGKSLYLFPDASAPMTEEEYLDYVSWALEGVSGDTDVKRVLSDSAVRVTVTVPGTVVRQEGGRAVGNTVEYVIPVLKVLTLSEPIDLSVTF